MTTDIRPVCSICGCVQSMHFGVSHTFTPFPMFNKKTYELRDGSGEVFETREMNTLEYRAAQDTANAATDGTFTWVEVNA